jgi:hypothetical protein
MAFEKEKNISDKVSKLLSEFISYEVSKKKDNPNHRIFLSEDYLTKTLNASSDEDINAIRICASSYIDAFNYNSNRFQIETDLDEYSMARAKAFREQGLL